MKVKALRGVCLGVDQHLAAGDTADLEPALVIFLVGIGAVEHAKDEPVKPQSVKPEPEKAEPPKDDIPKFASAKSGGKEK